VRTRSGPVSLRLIRRVRSIGNQISSGSEIPTPRCVSSLEGAAQMVTGQSEVMSSPCRTASSDQARCLRCSAIWRARLNIRSMRCWAISCRVGKSGCIAEALTKSQAPWTSVFVRFKSEHSLFQVLPHSPVVYWRMTYRGYDVMSEFKPQDVVRISRELNSHVQSECVSIARAALRECPLAGDAV